MMEGSTRQDFLQFCILRPHVLLQVEESSVVYMRAVQARKAATISAVSKQCSSFKIILRRTYYPHFFIGKQNRCLRFWTSAGCIQTVYCGTRQPFESTFMAELLLWSGGVNWFWGWNYWLGLSLWWVRLLYQLREFWRVWRIRLP